jgi:DNA-binding NarL/FixJ family response regulator
MLDVVLCIKSCIYREGLRAMLSARGELCEIRTCLDLAELGGLLDASPRALILIDIALGTAAASSIASIADAFRVARGQPVIALGLEESDDEILALIEAGAAAFVTKNDSFEDLIATIDATARGELHCAPRIARLMQKRLADLGASRERRSELDKLSQREHHVLGLVGQRMSNKQIARTLGLEVSTIKNHVHNIIVKLRVKNRGEAAAMLRAPYAANDAGREAMQA